MDINFRGLVSRLLPQPTNDGNNNPQPIRFGRYNEVYSVPLMRKQHALADEGSYFTANNKDSEITGQAVTSMDLTKPTILIQNVDSPGNSAAKRIYLDYITILNGSTAYSNATSNTGMFFYLNIDTILRYSSAGTALTVQNVNGDVPNRASIAQAYAGAIVTTTASPALRNITGRRFMRLPVSGTVMSIANADRWYFNFGGVEIGGAETTTDTTSATVENKWVSRSIPCPPIVIGPQQSFLFNINTIVNSASVGGTFFVDIGWIER